MSNIVLQEAKLNRTVSLLSWKLPEEQTTEFYTLIGGLSHDTDLSSGGW